MKSVRVEKPGGSVLFETGPHTIRPVTIGGLATLELVKQINLENEILWVNKDSPASKHRYIKYQNRLVLLRPPKRLLPDLYFITEPLLRKAIGGVLKYGLLPPRRPSDLEDESMASFFRRRTNNHVAKYLVSALVHGVYAGDYERLSMRSCFLRVLWDMETVGKRLMARPPEEQILISELKKEMGEDLVKKAAESRMYTFLNGTETLSHRLREKLEHSRVKIRTDSPVQTISRDGEAIKVRTPLQSHSFSHVISTIPLSKLFSTLPSLPTDLSKSFPPSVTVGVVNLSYKKDLTLPIQGFGYLIPKASPEENPEDALGVIIVPDALRRQDIGKYEGAIKLTVMLGGHYWRDRKSYPSVDELLLAAKSVVARDLGITVEPVVNLVSLQRDCITQYEVGHWERIQKLEQYLESTFGTERFKIVGSAVDGIGLTDCVLSARKTAKWLQELVWAEDLFE